MALVFFDARGREVGNRQPTVSPKASFTEFFHGARLERAHRWRAREQLEPVTSIRALGPTSTHGRSQSPKGRQVAKVRVSAA